MHCNLRSIILPVVIGCNHEGDAENAGVEIAAPECRVEIVGVEIAAPKCKGGNRGVEIAGEGKVWKVKVLKMCF